jgi:VWFA-related protein
VVFSDGEDTASWVPGEAVIELARRSEAVVYCIRVENASQQSPTAFRLDRRSGFHQSPGRATPADYFRTFMDVVADETGGEVLSLADSAGLESTFLRVLTRFRSRYLLSYTPQGVDASGWHTIEVELKNRRGEVRARRGYFRGDGTM